MDLSPFIKKDECLVVILILIKPDNMFTFILDFLLNPFNIGVFSIGFIFSYLAYKRYEKDKVTGRRLLNLVPATWTGLGILGTFIVLYAKLGHDNVELSASNDLGSLIKELASAFSTSLIGILGSLVSSVIIKELFRKEEEPNKSKEWFNKDPRQLLYEQNQTLTRIGIDFFTVSDKFQKSQQQHFEKLETAFEKRVGALHEIYAGKIEKMEAQQKQTLQRLEDSITLMCRQTTEAIKEALRILTHDLEEKVQQFSEKTLEDSSRRMEGVNQEFAANTKKLFEQNNNLMESGLNTVQGFSSEIATSLQEFKEVLNNGAKSISENFTTSIGDTSTNLAAIMNQLISDNAEKLESTFSRIDQWQKNSKLALEQTTTSFTGAVAQYQDLKFEQERVIELIQEQVTRLEEDNKQRQEVFNLLSSSVESSQEVENRIQQISQAVVQLGELKRILASLTVPQN